MNLEPWNLRESYSNQRYEKILSLNKLKNFSFSFDEPQEKPMEYEVSKGIAILSIQGELRRNKDMFSDMFGETSYESIALTLNELEQDESVSQVVLRVHSPGGESIGNLGLGQNIKSFSKPIHSFVTAYADSAAYMAVAGSDSITLENLDSSVGSVGTLLVHQEETKFDERIGIKTTVIRSGELKAIGNNLEELDEKALNELEKEVQYLASLFQNFVLENRKLSTTQFEDVKKGGIYYGENAISMGLADQIMNFDELIQSLTNNNIQKGNMGDEITLESLRKDHASVYSQIEKQVKTNSISAERERIKSIMELGNGLDSTFVSSLVFDKGLEVGEAAIEICKEQQKNGALSTSKNKDTNNNGLDVNKFFSEAPEAVQTDEPVNPKPKAKLTPEEEFNNSEELKAEFGSYDIYHAYLSNKSKTSIVSTGAK